MRDRTTLGRIRFLLGRLSLRQRQGDDEDQRADFEHLDPEYVPPMPRMTPPEPRRGTPSWTRSEEFRRFERNLIYMRHDR